MVKIILNNNGIKQEIDANTGQSVMEAAVNANVDIEASCGGCLSCATCHIVVDPAWFDKLPHAEEDETDMLDFADGLTKTSRLSCQIEITDDLHGFEFSLPESE